MARTLARASRQYAAGTYGPFTINQFPADVEAIELVLTCTGWPNVSPLMRIELAWNSGGKATFDVSGGVQRDRAGNVLSSVNFVFTVPKVAGQKRAVAGGTATVRTFAPVTTAIQLRTR